MVDLTAFKTGIEAAKSTLNLNIGDPREAFKNELYEAGMHPEANIVLNTLVRVSDSEDKQSKKSGWYIYSEHHNADDILAIGIYGSWHDCPPKTTWCNKSLNSMSTKDRLQYHTQLEAAKQAQEVERLKLQDEAAKAALDIWNKAEIAIDHPYLTRKQVKAYPATKVYKGSFIIPITFKDAITSIQFIKDDGSKLFKKYGKLKGCYYKIEGNEADIYIAEGYSTGASIAMATGATVYIAFNASNLYEVAAFVKQENPLAKITMAGDDDFELKSNTGKIKATQAAEGLQLSCTFPPQGIVDFNDLHVAQGIDALKAYLQPEIVKYKQPEIKATGASFAPPTGILAQIADYYNATAGNKQPLFAVQTALAIGSLICARSFETNFSNRTSLYFMNVAISGTGKEHGKKITEQILNAANSGHLIGQDGYHSGSAVFSALMDKPRHITSIDEFSKYLQAAQNKNSSQLTEANTSLMEVIGRLDGVMRPRAYAASLLSKDKRRELADMKIINPAITFIGMTTPDDLFQTVDVRAIKDGFLNRFIICLSSAERAIRVHKEPIDVPESIISWINKINSRRGEAEDIATDEPHLVTLSFTIKAIEMQNIFQQYCIDKANKIEQFGLSEIVGRSNEMAMRLALIAALSDDPFATHINEHNMEFGISWIKYNLEALIEKLKLSVSGSEHEGQKKEILLAIRQAKKGVTWTDMQKRPPFSKYKIKDLKDILQSLCESDLIVDLPYTSGKGRPTKIFHAQD